MVEVGNVFLNAFRELLNQMASWVPKIIVALVIWWIGKYVLNLIARWAKKIDIPGTKVDTKLMEKLVQVILTVGKIILVLIVLDYLGIGRTIIGAFVNGLTFAIAIGLGIAFGRALQPEARSAVDSVKKYIK